MAEVSEAGSPKKRGRPKGSPNKRTLAKAATASDAPKRARGRPKSKPRPEEVNGSSSIPGKRGRPKGSRNKKPKPVGRPRKHPLPPADELKKPKVWKPLGRPRKLPRADDSDGPGETPRRARGRPVKAGSKRAHVPKKDTSGGGPPRKRGRPKKSAEEPDSAVGEEPESAGEMDASE